MAETEAKVKVSADAKDLKNVAKAMREAFNPSVVGTFTAATRGLTKDLKGLTSQQGAMVKAMRDVAKSQNAWNKLAGQLKSVAEQANKATEGVDKLNKANERSDAAARKRRSFVAGAMQGSGLAQYMPAGEGMWRRAAGNVVGGAARRVAGAAAAPFTMPGMGGLSSMIQAIPLAGPAAAGALQAGQGMYGAYVGHQKARQANLYFATKNIGDTRTSAGSRRWLDIAASYAREAGEGKGERAVEAKKKLSALEDERVRRETRAGEVAAMSPGQRRASFQQSFQRVMTKEGLATAAKRHTGHVSDKQLKSQITAARIAVGQAWREDRKISGEDLETAKENARSHTTRVGGLGSSRYGIRLGYDPMQQEAMKGEHFGAAGGRFEQGQFNEAMAAKMMYGVSMGTSGQFAKLGHAGGGGTGMGSGLAGVLKAAAAQGMEGSEVTDYLQQLVSLGQEAQKQGVKINMTELTRQSGMFQAMGIGKLQRGQMVAGLNRKSRQVGARGVQGPADLMEMRAMGFDPNDPRGARVSYAETKNKMYAGMTNEGMANLFTMAAKGIGGVKGGKTPYGTNEIRKMHMVSWAAEHGMNISPAMGEKLFNAASGPNAKARLIELSEEYGISGAGGREQGDLMGAARGLNRKGAPGTVAAANLAQQRIAMGGKMSGIMVQLEQVGIRSVGVLSNFNGSIEKVVGTMGKWLKHLDKWTSSSSPGGGKKRKSRPGG